MQYKFAIHFGTHSSSRKRDHTWFLYTLFLALRCHLTAQYRTLGESTALARWDLLESTAMARWDLLLKSRGPEGPLDYPGFLEAPLQNRKYCFWPPWIRSGVIRARFFYMRHLSSISRKLYHQILLTAGYTVCPKSLDPFSIVTYHIKWGSGLLGHIVGTSLDDEYIVTEKSQFFYSTLFILRLHCGI